MQSINIISSSLSLVLWFSPASAVLAGQIDIPGPAGSEAFGTQVARLANGNFVVTDPLYDAPGPIKDVGAVYLYNGKTRKLISRLTGGTANDRVGQLVMPLKNGNYVVTSPDWSNGNALKAGAVTWCDGNVGIDGKVSSTNSLVGSSENDSIGHFVTPLVHSNHYLVHSFSWNNGSAKRAGALTWGNGDTGVRGAVSPSNSLVGSQSGDGVGMIARELKSGDYVAVSSMWSNGSIPQAGAVTWCNGKSGRTGTISAANSLVGDQALGGFFQVTPLENGHYVVSNSFWNNGSILQAGAVRWCPGNAPTTGIFTGAGALVGDRFMGRIGIKVTALTNGNYVVESPAWPNNDNIHYGAVTHCNGTNGRTGTVAESNSLTGLSKIQPGSSTVIPLTNGNYVVNSYGWVDESSSLAGAVTWCDGNKGRIEKVSAQNSLVGSHPFGVVGGSLSTTPLKNGNYVVASPEWSQSGISSAGAVTWCDGTKGRTGLISTSNSLVGSRSDDRVGSGVVTALENGNYVVGSPDWARGAVKRAGAATWCNGSTGKTGTVSHLNSLVGAATDDQVGRIIHPLVNGNYVVGSPDWDNGSVADAGAATWGDGSSGTIGEISSANSLVGSRSGDRVTSWVSGFWGESGNDYLVHSWDWQNGSLRKAGAVTWGDGVKGSKGFVNGSNSVLGRIALAGNTLATNLWSPRELLIVGQPRANLVSIFEQSAPTQPEISVQQPARSELADGKSKRDIGRAVAKSKKGVTKTFVIRNTGNAPLTGIRLTKGGRNKRDFQITRPPASSVAPGKKTSFRITFRPKTKGRKNAWIRIASNDADENPFDISITGVAVKK